MSEKEEFKAQHELSEAQFNALAVEAIIEAVRKVSEVLELSSQYTVFDSSSLPVPHLANHFNTENAEHPEHKLNGVGNTVPVYNSDVPRAFLRNVIVILEHEICEFARIRGVQLFAAHPEIQASILGPSNTFKTIRDVYEDK